MTKTIENQCARSLIQQDELRNSTFYIIHMSNIEIEELKTFNFVALFAVEHSLKNAR